MQEHQKRPVEVTEAGNDGKPREIAGNSDTSSSAEVADTGNESRLVEATGVDNEWQAEVEGAVNG